MRPQDAESLRIVTAMKAANKATGMVTIFERAFQCDGQWKNLQGSGPTSGLLGYDSPTEAQTELLRRNQQWNPIRYRNGLAFFDGCSRLRYRIYFEVDNGT